jgi:REP element-mobilizing transposase RayT
VKNRENWFGEISDGEMNLNSYGDILSACWLNLPNHYKNCILDVSIVMPNHFHGILIINNCVSVGTDLKPVPKKHGLSEIIRGFKTFASIRINQISNNEKVFRWQRSFHDHIVRNEKSLETIRKYITNNPHLFHNNLSH